MDRISDSGSEGWGFESLRGHQIKAAFAVFFLFRKSLAKITGRTHPFNVEVNGMHRLFKINTSHKSHNEHIKKYLVKIIYFFIIFLSWIHEK